MRPASSESVGLRWLVDGVLAGGPHPSPSGDPGQLSAALDELQSRGLGAVVSVCELPLDVPPGSPVEYLFAPTDDGEAPEDLERICELIDAVRRRGAGTFVHCLQGQGRTGTVLAAYLIWSEHKRALEAIEDVRRLYNPRAVETAQQVSALEAFARRHRLL